MSSGVVGVPGNTTTGPTAWPGMLCIVKGGKLPARENLAGAGAPVTSIYCEMPAVDPASDLIAASRDGWSLREASRLP